MEIRQLLKELVWDVVACGAHADLKVSPTCCKKLGRPICKRLGLASRPTDLTF